MNIIDAHQHVWDLGHGPYAWLGTDPGPINRSIAFEESLPHLDSAGITGSVLVQADDNWADTELMLATAARLPERVAGVVGWVPLDRPEEAAGLLARWAEPGSLLVGVRNLIHDLPDPEWLLRPEVDEGLGELERAGVPFDLVAVLPRHLELVPILSERHPELRIVIDHLSKPPIGVDPGVGGPWAEGRWERLMADAAANPRVFGKVSGLYSGTGDPSAWTPGQVRPYLETALSLFGSTRLMYGGDWPVSVLAGGYERVWAGLTELFDAVLSPREREDVLHGTAEAFYGLK